MRKDRLLIALIVLTAIGLSVLVYTPGLGGIFLFDDKPNIVDNKGLLLEDHSFRSFVDASLSGVSTLKRPVSMFSFALNIELCGLTPYCFKVVNLAIHIIVGLLLFVFVRLLMSRYREYYNHVVSDNVILLTAASVSLLWLLHPVNLTNVLYVVQRMNSLSACFSLAGMIFYIIGRNKLLKEGTGQVYVALGFLMTVPAMFSKENGILLPYFLLLIEVFFYRLKCENNSSRQLLKLAFIISVIVPVTFIAGYLIANPDWLQKIYAYREFSLYERLLTETRVIWLYVGLILLPSNQRLSLFHDHLEISRGLFEPITTFYAIISLLVVVAIIIYARKRQPLVSYGLLFFLGGHMIESTFIPLELVFEHRNYLPAIGLLIPLGYYLLNNDISARTIRIRQTALVTLILLFGIVTSLRASQWGNPLLLAELEVANNSSSPRVHNLAGNIYASMLKRLPEENKERYYERALGLFEKTSQLDPNNTSGLVSVYILQAREEGINDIDIYHEILDRLQEKKLTATDTVAIKQLLSCIEENTCSEDIADVEALGRAIELNPYDSGRYKAIAYGTIGSYYWNQDIDKEQALYYIEQAYENYKDSRILNLNYAKILTAIGRYDEARSILEKIKKDDFFGLRQTEVRQLEIVINNNDYRAGNRKQN